MKATCGRIMAACVAMCIVSASYAQQQRTTASGATARPAIAFPPTPTPAPKEEPMTPEEVEAHVVPGQFLSKTSDVLVLAYNGFRRSQVDPCGCVSHKLGGLDKEARILASIDELGLPALQLDAGGFIRDMPDQKAVSTSKYLLKGLGELGYDAVNVGFTDLALTPEELKAAAEEAGVQLVSANIMDASGQLVFEPYIVKEVQQKNGQPLKVGVIGVTRPRVQVSAGGTTPPSQVRSGSATGTSETLTITDPVAAIEKYAQELAEKTDFVVVMDYDRRNKAVEVVKGLTDKSLVDVLIMGENTQIQGSVQPVDGVQVVSGGYEGRQIGTLYLELKDNDVASTWNKHINVEQTLPPVPQITAIIEEAHKSTTPAEATGTSPTAPGVTPATPTKLDLGT